MKIEAMPFHTHTQTHFLFYIFLFVPCRWTWYSRITAQVLESHSIEDKLSFLHTLSLLNISFSQLQNSPQWAVVHLTELPTHNSTQFHATVFLCSRKSIAELQWRPFSIASREADNFVACLHSIHLLLNKEGTVFSLMLPAFRNLNMHQWKAPN